jgi:SAM-dependent methyltransferase
MHAWIPSHWPWPLPAVAAWLVAWSAFLGLGAAGVGAAPAFAVALACGALLALTARGRWRRALVATGFPLSTLALGGLPVVPAWAWGAAALPLALAYPLRAWRDAPFFPTPALALEGLAAAVPLAPGARVLDAGCGLGHGLAALRRAWPAAELHGIEWSRPLAWGAARRCRDAKVTRGDMWAASWAGFELVYLFQRPESMARALDKARREMPGGWLVSLEFEAPGIAPAARLGSRPLWVYRIPASITGPGRR